MSDTYSDHHIVCGFDPVGRVVARELRTAGATYVVVDTSDAASEIASILGAPFLQGSPSDSQVLREAGIARARSLVACADDDAANLAAVTVARELRDDLEIVARAADDAAEQRLRRAGAQRIVSLEGSGGRDLARLALHPPAGVPQAPGAGFRVAEIMVEASGAGAGHAVGVVRGSAIVVGVRRANGWFMPMPPDDTQLRPGDSLMALGTPAALASLEQLMLGSHLPKPAAEALPRTTRRL